MSSQRLSELIKQRITASGRTVFLPTDVSDGDSEKELASALGELVDRQLIAPIGESLFARTRRNVLTGTQMLDTEGGFLAVCQESLTRLGVEWQFCQAELAYNGRASDQIPTNAVFKVVGDYYPEISFKGFRIRYET